MPVNCTQTALGIDPLLNTGLAQDCATLLGEKDTLRGTGPLNWSEDTAMTDWDGITLSGDPQRVTSIALTSRSLTGSIPASLGTLSELRTLSLDENQLTGTIPAQLGSLTKLTRLALEDNQLTGMVPVDLANLTGLTTLHLAGNMLAGCVPAVWKDVADNDFMTLALPVCGDVTSAYSSYDTVGEATTAGSYAFLMKGTGGEMVAATTYQELRAEASALLIHKSDASGVSRATHYDDVSAGDTFDWRFGSDCWVGYRVMEVKPDPAGTAPRKLLAVEPYGYAYTGCSGAINTSAAVLGVWRDPPNYGGQSLRVPVVYGAFQVVPLGWQKETLFFGEHSTPPADSAGDSVVTRVLAEAQQLPYWRDLPGWTFASAESGTYDAPVYGYCARFHKPSPTRGEGVNDWVDVCGTHSSARQTPFWSMDTEDGWVNEVRIINGYPAKVSYYLPTSRLFNRIAQITVVVYDDAVGSAHYIDGDSTDTLGTNVDAVIAIAALMFPNR